MSLVKLENVSLAFGHHHLLDHSNLVIEPRQRFCLVGRNGAGKSTLLKLINREIVADDGQVVYQDNLRIAKLDQAVPQDQDISVYDFVAKGIGELSKLLTRYHAALKESEQQNHSEESMKKLFAIQHELDSRQGWDFQRNVDNMISKLELPADSLISELSGGWRRRALLAQALVSSPNLLLLDEPTNHLDIEAITWLEEFLLGQQITIVFISHDRRFIKRLATQIVDLDRGKLKVYPGDFEKYLELKEKDLEVEAQHNALFDKNLAKEEVWIRQGIKARRTRNEGRVRRLKALRQERSVRRDKMGKADFSLSTGESSGKLVFEADDISYSWENKPLIKNFSCRVMRGDRIGLIGPNGTGKTSLLRILLGNLQPTSGKVISGTKQVIAYFDQQRAQLDPEKNLIENVIENSEMITINGVSRHIVSYLKDFLFEPERMHSPVKTLSGGETNRLLLAKLFTKTANILVMDEPTNDLDMETLDLLEDLLTDFDGTILLVSHDRDFLDNVVTSTWVFEGNGQISEYVGGYEDYIRYKNSQSKTEAVTQKQEAKPKENAEKPTLVTKKSKLSYKDQRELDALPQKIEALEKEQESLHQLMSSSEFYKLPINEQQKKNERTESIVKELENSYQRWEELDQSGS